MAEAYREARSEVKGICPGTRRGVCDGDEVDEGMKGIPSPLALAG